VCGHGNTASDAAADAPPASDDLGHHEQPAGYMADAYQVRHEPGDLHLVRSGIVQFPVALAGLMMDRPRFSRYGKRATPSSTACRSRKPPLFPGRFPSASAAVKKELQPTRWEMRRCHQQAFAFAQWRPGPVTRVPLKRFPGNGESRSRSRSALNQRFPGDAGARRASSAARCAPPGGWSGAGGLIGKSRTCCSRFSGSSYTVVTATGKAPSTKPMSRVGAIGDGPYAANEAARTPMSCRARLQLRRQHHQA